MPSSPRLRATVVKAISDLPVGTRVVDIGSGWGGMVRRIARERPDLNVEGFERSAVPYVVSAALLRAGRLRAGYRNARMRREDFRTVGPEDDTCYIAYLSPDGMKWLRELFERATPRNVRLVSCVFAMRGWTAAETIELRDLKRSRVYVYQL